MDGLRTWIGKWQNEINMTITVLIALAVIIFGGWNVVIGIKDFGKRKMNEGLKALGYAALIIFVGIIGWAGLTELVKAIAPSGGVIPQG